MNKAGFFFLAVSLAMISSCGESSAGKNGPSTPPITDNGGLPRATLGNFTYQGAFKMDHSTVFGDSDASYAAAVFELSNDSTSFYFGGRKSDTTLGQFQIPQLLVEDSPDDLNVSPMLQNFSSFLGKKDDSPKFEGLRNTNGKSSDK